MADGINLRKLNPQNRFLGKFAKFITLEKAQCFYNFVVFQADKLVSKSKFPSGANNCEMARYLFYLG